MTVVVKSILISVCIPGKAMNSSTTPVCHWDARVKLDEEKERLGVDRSCGRVQMINVKTWSSYLDGVVESKLEKNIWSSGRSSE